MTQSRTDGAQPLILVVSGDEGVRQRLVHDIARRFGADYAVMAVATTDAALVRLESQIAEGGRIALVIAEERLSNPPPADFLLHVRRLEPHAKRILLIKRGNWSSDHPIVAGMALGRIDYHLFDPWAPLEQILYPSISEFLAAWNTTQDAPSVAVRIVGHQLAARSHEVRDLLTRGSVPYWFFSPETEAGRQVLAEAGEDGTRLPVMLFHSGAVLVDPTNADVVDVLGVSTSPPTTTCDVLVVGAGPAGLAAAVYAASEGLHTMVVEPEIPGGQAGTSSLIRNYLGFRHGVSGQDLGVRASEQAWLFGVDFVLTQRATSVEVRDADRIVHTTDGSAVSARAVVLATGVAWRRLNVPALEALVGAGVFYGAAGGEARATQGCDVVVVGGGNSAGQAAVHLARYARSVTMLVRGSGLAATMSKYLITEITSNPAISVRVRSEIVDGGGSGGLEVLTVVDHTTGRQATISATALFVLIGAEPHTGWLAGTVARDSQGYLLTGQLAGTAEVAPAWPLERPPMLLETSVPGVFAAGDVRSRSVKRVAAAVGEGATAVRLIHAYLAGEYA
ncbi:MAG TPA: FAD-dependent oxidoreductase [Propionibacteriaceae bacterium]|nr:FAD-dependent oxidoreductase [Propionibacteriaceae bacterium]